MIAPLRTGSSAPRLRTARRALRGLVPPRVAEAARRSATWRAWSVSLFAALVAVLWLARMCGLQLPWGL